MKGSFCVFVISVFFVITNEQCPQNVEHSSLTTCHGSTKYGPFIYVDFFKINHPCTCILTPSFVGGLLVILEKGANIGCNTQVNVGRSFIFSCTHSAYSATTLSVQINQSEYVSATYSSQSTSGTFSYCMKFQQNQQNGGSNGNLSLTCGSPSDATSTAISTSTLTSKQLSQASSPAESSIESTPVVKTIENTDVTLSSNTTNISYDSLSMESTQDDPKHLYIIAGSVGGGAIILVGLIVLSFVFLNRKRSVINKNGSTEADMARTNEVFDSNPELPDNPLYLSSQPMDELGYSLDQEKQLGLPPTDSKTKKKINSNYDVPPKYKPIDHGTSSMPVYAVPKRSKDCTTDVSTGDDYAEVCKPNKSIAHVPVRKHNEDGLLYMEVEQDIAATKRTNTNEITEGVSYAEIKRT